MIFNNFGYPLAVISGLCAACTSLYSKLLNVNKYLLIISSYGGAVVLNVIMWLAFVTALSLGRKSVVIIATNTLSNFAFSAVFGRYVFQEELTGNWLAGMLCLSIGIIFLLREQ